MHEMHACLRYFSDISRVLRNHELHAHAALTTMMLQAAFKSNNFYFQVNVPFQC